ncbi:MULTISPECIES: MalY/PatB family protein [unclassified Sporosarcina]|uniref:MalY/PatB family protein n=1 Tax=unclassified Sporosarcina TaxID=2647733 RepID=UPI00203C5CFF|nr:MULTISPECIES: MalY/PatB family protein [unclassified Sporosarcina]GKV65132.1 cystathionine beta-lyase [Sporosarcina sp. NCCP-2331]GLB55256.1 cystathionine beta-lyase [Sporosarcina sp. NCCP-2378]
MKLLDLNKVYQRRNTDSVKWDHMDFMDERTSETTLPLWLSDMEFKVADEIVDAMKNRVEHGFFGQSMPGNEYLDAICGWYQRRFNWTIDKNSIFYSPGILPAIGFAIAALTKPGDGVIIQPPVFYPFSEIIKGQGRTIVNNTLINENGDYKIDFADLQEKASDPNNKILLLCSPQNPIGRVWTKSELEQIASICEETNTYIFADEIHCDLIRKNVQHFPIQTITDYKNIIVAVSPSKTFNTAGLPIASIIIDDNELRKIWLSETKGKYYIRFAPPLDMVMSKAAYTQCEYWLEQVLEYIEDNYDFMEKYLTEHLPKTGFKKPEGTYLAWVNFGAYVDHEELLETLISKYDLLIESGVIFGGPGFGYFRLSIACPRSQLEEGLSRIVAAITDLT